MSITTTDKKAFARAFENPYFRMTTILYPTHMLHRLTLFICCIAIFSCQAEKDTSEELGRWEAQAERVEILRDDFGVPHIYGKSDADAVF